MRKVYVPLKQAEVEALVRLANDERRRPQEQAALIIAERLRAVEQLESNRSAVSAPVMAAK